MENFLPWHGFAGGLMIGAAAALLMLLNGRILGVSGLLESAWKPGASDFNWSIALLTGLPLGALLVASFAPGLVPTIQLAGGLVLMAISGFVVGFGARVGSGCTSGHGVCGLPRFSIRAITATGIFMVTAALTVFVARHLI